MIEAIKFWNEPNNKSHWDLELDPGWQRYGQMVQFASQAVRAVNPHLTQVLGGISPIDAGFMEKLRDDGVLRGLDAVAVHGFPLDIGCSMNGPHASPRFRLSRRCPSG